MQRLAVAGPMRQTLRRAPQTTSSVTSLLAARRLTSARPAFVNYTFTATKPGAALAAANLRLRVRAPALRCLSTAQSGAEENEILPS